MIRLAHFSDIHVTASPLGWQTRDWFCKRFTSWFNQLLRSWRFARAAEIVTVLMDELAKRDIHHVVFSGDATALGFEAEIARAAQLMRVGQFPISGLAIPGNHDYCTRHAADSGAFERHFALWQGGRRVDGHVYPFAQQVGPAWLVAVNAATGNVIPWDAGGHVGVEQLQRLGTLLAELGPGLKILVLHYPICLSSGRRETRHHGLRDLDALLEVAHAGGVNLWLHGHRHSAYHFQEPPGASFPVICAGAATQRNLWSYGEYTIDDNTLQAVRRVFDPAARCFRDAETFTLRLG